MSQVISIAKREIRSFFDHPTAYVLAVAFLTLSFYLSFRALYAMGSASLRPFFDLMPWLFVVFVPAATMRSLAEERRSKTLSWLIAQPLGESQVVLGKFLGNWSFVLITLGGTLPMALGILAVSEADAGIVLAQYLGAALLAAQMVAIGIWTSSVTRNQVTAFILGASIAFGLVLIGTPLVQVGLPRSTGNLVGHLSVLSHFHNVARGVVDFRDVLYFVSTTGLFLFLSVVALSRHRLSPRSTGYRHIRWGGAVVAGSVIVLNLLGGHIRGRIDLTQNNLFTLSQGSRTILGDLEDIVNLRLFISEELPQEIQVTLRDVRDLVSDLEGASNGNLLAQEINPNANDESAQEAADMGVFPIEFNVIRDDELQIKRGYFGIAITYADKQEVFPVISRTDDLEFQLVSAITGMVQTEKPRMAFLTGFGARGLAHYGAFRQTVSERFTLSDLHAQEEILRLSRTAVDVLVIAGPTEALPPEAVTAVEDFVGNGGSVLFLLEKHLISPQTAIATPITTGLEALLSARGIEAPGQLVFDMASSERISMGRQGLFNVIRAYPLWPIAFKGSEHATVRDLNNVSLGWATNFTFRDSTVVTPLWITTEGGGLRPPGSPIDPESQMAPSDGGMGQHVMAVAIGNGASDRGASIEESDTKRDEGRPDEGGPMVVVGDADFLEDRFVQTNPQNLVFAANAVDWLARDESLISIRSKDRRPPTLAFESAMSSDLLKWGCLLGVPLLFIGFGAYRIGGKATRAKRRWEGHSA